MGMDLIQPGVRVISALVGPGVVGGMGIRLCLVLRTRLVLRERHLCFSASVSLGLMGLMGVRVPCAPLIRCVLAGP